MSKQLLISFIERNIPNIKVSADALGIITDSFEEIDFQKNEFLLKEGKVSDYYYPPPWFVAHETIFISSTLSTKSFPPLS